ncbi:MAG: DUF5110 domain-containing protein [Clostridiaceae bacterium]|nr:DUF5110 domain-containing protein [Clostridiaceae bacterium]
MLPAYLKFSTPDAASPAGQIVTSGDLRFTVLTSRLIRIERGGITDAATLTVINRSFAAPEFTQELSNGLLTIRTEHLELTYRTGQELSAETLQIRLLSRPYTLWHFGEQPLQNLGGTVSTLDRINGACPIDDGVCSIDGYALIDDSETPLITEEGWFRKRKDGLTDLYFFGYGHDYTACVQDYYRLTGVPEMLPAFVFGNWWSRYHNYTAQEYLALMDCFHEKDVPLSVGIVDMDWHLTDGDGREYWTDGWTGYTWNPDYFPDYREFLKELKKRNLKTALNLHPALGVRSWDAAYEAMAKVLHRDTSSGEPVYFDCLSQDFWRAYFEILHFPYEEDGVDFWWIDWQQGTDYSWIPGGGKDELTCMKPLWMLNHMHHLAAQRHGGRGFIFSRFAGFGSQRYPVGFSGDSAITWESLAFQPYFTVTASNIGYGWWSHDIGGHMGGGRDDELTVRWIQFGVFSPIFRLHSSNDTFSGREPWNYNRRAELIITNFMRLRHRLFPYLYTMCYRNYRELIPLMRPMYHTHPEVRSAYEVPNQYWFGSEMIAAPITEQEEPVSGLGGTDVWLPEGTWIDGFTGYVYHGGRRLRVFRPLEEMPVFLKSGAIVPMQAHTPYENSLGGSCTLELLVAAGASNYFELYEDDGETLAYQTNDCCKTGFTLDWQETRAVFTIHPAEGDRTLIPDARGYTICFRGFAEGCTFVGPDGILPAVYDCKTNAYTLSLDGVTAADGASITIEAPRALLHDDGDCYDRILDLLLRSQCTYARKHELLDRVDKLLNKENPDRYDICSDSADALPAAIFELLTQLLPDLK